MTEAAAAGGGARAELERRLLQRSLQDEDFRQQLLSEPKAIIEREIGTQLPEEVLGAGADAVLNKVMSYSTIAEELRRLADR